MKSKYVRKGKCQMTDIPAPHPGSMFERVRRGDVFRPDCPSREVMRHVTSQWGVLVLIALQGGVHRFSALRPQGERGERTDAGADAAVA